MALIVRPAEEILKYIIKRLHGGIILGDIMSENIET
jgi:hypothetical protein